jgi:hypothetical protein
MKLRLKNINGREVNKIVTPYLIKWKAKSRSKFQFSVKQFLEPLWRHQICFEEFPVYGTLQRVDFLNATKKIAIEVNGRQHTEYVEHFHKNRANYLRSIKRDWVKTEWLESNDFQLVEIEIQDLPHLSPEWIDEKFGIEID